MPTPATSVEAALNYAAYAADWRLAVNGEALWGAKFGSRAKGDELLGKRETETRPDACLRILSGEVLRLRGCERYIAALEEVCDSDQLARAQASMPNDQDQKCGLARPKSDGSRANP